MVVMLVAVVIYNIIILQTHALLLDGFSKAPYPTDNLDRYLQAYTHTHPFSVSHPLYFLI